MLHTLLFILQNIQHVPVRFEASSERQNVREHNYMYNHIIDCYICIFYAGSIVTLYRSF